MEWFAAEARRAWGETISSPIPSKRLLSIKQPIGVSGMITPVSFYQYIYMIFLVFQKYVFVTFSGCLQSIVNLFSSGIFQML